MFSILPSQLNVINDVQPSNAFMPNDLIPFTVTEVNDVHSEKALSAIIVPASSNVIFSTPVFQKAAVPISLTLFKLIFFNVATCTENGWKEVGVCEVCGEHYSYPTEENAIPATGHTWSEDYVVDKAATCTEAGEKSKHCTACDAKEDVQEIPALGHDFVSKVTKKATCTADGTLTYTCSRCNETKTETIKATGHKWSNWKRTTAATVFKPEVQTRKCSACNKSETRNIGKKLAPKATLNASTVTLKVKQSTSRLKVTGLAKGDSVKSWKSSNSKIFTVRGKSNGTCKITGKKRGTAKLQITLASGLKKTVKVKVQTVAVKTSKITVSKNVTVRKGKRVTLKTVVTPFTSRQKVTYTSSNKKIATVSSKGVVTGKKKGTVKITVKSGSKSVKVTVKVK